MEKVPKENVMKNIQTLFTTAMCGLVLAFTAAASAQDIKQGVATVVRVRGVANYTLESGPNSQWIPLVAGKVLMAGSTIKTAPDATVDIVLGKNIEMPQARVAPDRVAPSADSPIRGLVTYTPSVEQNTIRMTGETTLKIDKLTVSDTGVDTVSDTELDLQKGRIFANVKKLSAASQYLVKIPSGIAGVRGTFFGIDASGWCAVLRHQVDLALVGPGGVVVTHTIGEGSQFDPGTGQTTPLPQEVLNFLQHTYPAITTFYPYKFSLATPRTDSYVSPTSGTSGSGSGSGSSGSGGVEETFLSPPPSDGFGGLSGTFIAVP
jgi:FecR protein